MNKPEAEQIAAAIAIVRPRWLQSSLVTMLGNLPAEIRRRPARDVHLALLWLAYDPQQDTPRLLREDGPWWNLASLAGPGTQRATEPGIVTYCEHGEPGMRCLECYPRRTPTGTGPTPEQRAQIRAGNEAGRQATHDLARPHKPNT